MTSTTYLVGGAVRDELLGYPFSERDWVVTGSNTEAMLAKGFKQVGKDFPVFLHPETKEEYALARQERKTASGYHGFDFNTGEDVSIEDDLIRRDLTINAIAKTSSGEIVDPYNGRQDLKNKILRHVSPAFAEDPVRILRVARFAARYHHLGFRVAGETIQLMQSMVNNGEVNSLVAERVWKETQRALMEANPQEYFYTLQLSGALAVIFPEIQALFGIPQPPKYHPEIDTGLHTMLALKRSAVHNADAETRFAVLVHDLGKAISPKEYLPSHRGHEKAGLPLVKQLCQRLAVPNGYKELALKVTEYHLHSHRLLELKASTLLSLIEKLNGLKTDKTVQQFSLACRCDAEGRTGLENQPYPQTDFLLGAQRIVANISIDDIDAENLKGKAIGEALRRKRLSELEKYKQQQRA